MLVAPLAKKFKVSMIGYPLSYYENNGKFFLLVFGNLIGDEKNRKMFLAKLKKDKRTLKIDMNNDGSGFSVMEQNPVMKILYDLFVVHVKPIIINEKGENIWEIAS